MVEPAIGAAYMTAKAGARHLMHTIALELDVQPTPVVGNRDDLQRVATNLIENALRHTPTGTRVTASTRPLPDGTAELVVAELAKNLALDAPYR